MNIVKAKSIINLVDGLLSNTDTEGIGSVLPPGPDSFGILHVLLVGIELPDVAIW